MPPRTTRTIGDAHDPGPGTHSRGTSVHRYRGPVQVSALWRYPVKSMQGERLESAVVGPRGVEGDRRWAVLDRRTGLTLTARRTPALLMAAACLDGARVRVVLPGGDVARDDGDLSEWLGRPVGLEEASPVRRGRYETPIDVEDEAGPWLQWEGPAGTFHDSTRTRVSLITTASMRDWDVRRFRPNVVLDGASEDDLVGSRMALGTTMLDVVKHIDRCVVVARPQPGLPRDLEPLRTINREHATFLGVGALVVAPGRLSVGDELA